MVGAILPVSTNAKSTGWPSNCPTRSDTTKTATNPPSAYDPRVRRFILFAAALTADLSIIWNSSG
jgi:hypothetical protein